MKKNLNKPATGLILTGIYDFVCSAVKVGRATGPRPGAAGFAPADATTAQEFASGTFAKLQSLQKGCSICFCGHKTDMLALQPGGLSLCRDWPGWGHVVGKDSAASCTP